MDTRSGLVRYDYDPAKHDGVPIPAHLTDAAIYCADHGIALHTDANPHAELRTWARAWRAREAAERASLTPDPSYAPPAPAVLGHRYHDLRRERAQQYKAAIKRRRKLQKARGLR